ncbi:zf-CCHC domain-containing protein [Tanacetum coccineum]
MFEREKLSGSNFNDWFRSLKLVLRVDKKLYVIEQPILPSPAAGSTHQAFVEWNTIYDAHIEVACFMLGIKDNKIDLLVQQYEQFTILEEESINNSFYRFNTIITSLKALDEGFSNKKCVRKFLRSLHLKWRAKVMAIEESKDLSSLALDELIGNLKLHKVIKEKDSEIYKDKKERVKSITLKAKKESSDDETSTSKKRIGFVSIPRRGGIIIPEGKRDNKKSKSDRKCLRCGDPKHLLSECPNLHGTRKKKPLSRVLEVIAQMKPSTKSTKKLVSWLNLQIRFTSPGSCGAAVIEDSGNDSAGSGSYGGAALVVIVAIHGEVSWVEGGSRMVTNPPMVANVLVESVWIWVLCSEQFDSGMGHCMGVMVHVV